MSLLEINNLSKTYHLGKDNAVEAVRDFSLSVNSGEMLAIVGRSGSGKSTLLHIIGGMDTPTGGTVLYQGKAIPYKNLNKLAAYRNKQVGFVLQNFGLLMRESAVDNVCVPLLFSGCTPRKAKRKALEIMDEVGIASLAGRNVSELSGGQKQRVAIARALVNSPELILADEPTGALDSRTSAEIVDLLKSLNRQGKTVIVVTHDMAVAQECDRIIELADGQKREM